MAQKDAEKSTIVLGESLQGYFFEELTKINDKSSHPLPRQAILYSSMVMSNMKESKKYFDTTEGKVREKVLGIRLMESDQMPVNQRKRVLRDIGDTTLLLCGYFFKSISKKIVDVSYYQELGKTAYRRLDVIDPEMYDIASFYMILSEYFEQLTTVISIVANKLRENNPDEESIFLIVQPCKLVS